MELMFQIASSAPTGSRSHRPTASSKLRYTISKPKPNYPPATSLAGLTMREMTEEEVVEAYERRGIDGGEDKGEKWFTFEHNPVWREIERQFMGAVRSHGGYTSVLVDHFGEELTFATQTRTSSWHCCKCTPGTWIPCCR